MDTQRLRELAESADERAKRCHVKYETNRHFEDKTGHKVAASHLNDYFYWIGHANAYKGVIAMVELQTVVDEEVDATPQCP